MWSRRRQCCRVPRTPAAPWAERNQLNTKGLKRSALGSRAGPTTTAEPTCESATTKYPMPEGAISIGFKPRELGGPCFTVSTRRLACLRTVDTCAPISQGCPRRGGVSVRARTDGEKPQRSSIPFSTNASHGGTKEQRLTWRHEGATPHMEARRSNASHGGTKEQRLAVQDHDSPP